MTERHYCRSCGGRQHYGEPARIAGLALLCYTLFSVLALGAGAGGDVALTGAVAAVGYYLLERPR